MAKINLTPGRISDHSCESGQSFLWDSTVGGLGVRSTPSGAKAFIVQSRFAGKAIRITLGDVGSITLDAARTESRRLLLMIEQGIDPREQKRQCIADQAAVKEARERQDSEKNIKALLVADVWDEYLKDRKSQWGDRHYQDHINLAQTGGEAAKRGPGIKKPGPLAPLMRFTLNELVSRGKVEAWLSKEAPARMTQTRLALRLLKAFLNWCNVHETYGPTVDTTIITRRITSTLPMKTAKTDCLQREQLAGWFSAVRQIQNPVISAYLQMLLLTGARRRELSGLRWTDIDSRWKSITIHDKVEGLRVIPLTPFCESLLDWLPKRNEWVFSSPAAKSGKLQEPIRAHKRALAIASIEGLTIHGLRRSFGSLSEWVELPVGIVAQIMGHKPSATAEKHYRVRPLDLLRMWHAKLEEWILEQSGITIPARQEEREPLKLVAAN